MTERILVDLSAPVAQALDLPRHVPVRVSAVDELRGSNGLDLQVLSRELKDSCLEDPALERSLGHGIALLDYLQAHASTPAAETVGAGGAPVGDVGTRSPGVLVGAVLLLVAAAVAFFVYGGGDDDGVAPAPVATLEVAPTTLADQAPASTQPASTTTTGAPTTAPATTTTTTTTTIPLIVVPSVTGSIETDAVAALEALGLVASVQRTESYDAPPGVVLSTDPAAAAELPPGSSIALVVAARPVECNDRAAEIPGAGFSDVATVSAEKSGAIDWAASVGLVSRAGEFRPNDPTSRGGAITILWRYLCEPSPGEVAAPFVDVAVDAFYGPAVDWAFSLGIVGGTSSTTFSPDDPISRAAFVTIAWRALGEPADQTPLPFADVQAGAFYLPALHWAVGAGLVNGTSPTTFAPNDPLDRITTVVLFDRIERTINPLVARP